MMMKRILILMMVLGAAGCESEAAKRTAAAAERLVEIEEARAVREDLAVEGLEVERMRAQMLEIELESERIKLESERMDSERKADEEAAARLAEARRPVTPGEARAKVAELERRMRELDAEAAGE